MYQVTAGCQYLKVITEIFKTVCEKLDNSLKGLNPGSFILFLYCSSRARAESKRTREQSRDHAAGAR